MQVNVQAEFLGAIRAAGCLQHGDMAVLGVSGGADSLALLHLFARSDLGVRPHVLHLNHHIRGDEADADAEYVAGVCAEWKIPCRIAEADVPALARKERLTVEDAARQARYRALAEEAGRVGARVIAVAHNADDQAETILMHFLRGSGLGGLRGMRPVTPLAEFKFLESPRDCALLRPLLGVPRAEIDAYCAANGLTPRLDHTNLDMTYARNRLRHEIIPMLEKIAPGLRARLARTASIITADVDQLERDLDIAWGRVAVRPTRGLVMLNLDEWRGLLPSLQRASIRRAVMVLKGGLSDIGFVHVEEAMQIGQGGTVGARTRLPGGVSVQVGYDALLVTLDGEQPAAPDWPLLDPGTEIGLAAPGMVELASGWRLAITPYDGPRSGPDWDTLLADPWSAVLGLSESDRGDLRLRTRRSGDRFRPQGAGGSQKVNEFMINAKIPAEWRERVPLLIAGERIAWVCGWRVDQGAIVTVETKDAWLAQFEKNE